MPLSDEEYQLLSKMIEETSGLKLEARESYLLEYRLTALAQEMGCLCLKDLYEKALQKKELREKIALLMCTHETSFFRDRLPFEILKRQFLPQLIARIGVSEGSLKRPIRIWSAGCSSGQEAYSIAISAKEVLPKPSSFEIIATDLSSDMIEQAKKGLFSSFEMGRGIKEMQKSAYFTGQDSQWQVKPEIRRLIEFKPLNLLTDWGDLPLFDIIFCRHVLIYFAPEVKKALLERFARQLNAQGTLVLGTSEKADVYSDLFSASCDLEFLSYQKIAL
ncbi:MAG: hypothetical protein K0S07_580 [Chlamydiales bacterium]|jgi:chemotaxis protein methyltransferase CheR|nr:hypothetical protein [Chlamydiales bacterium]